MLQETHVTEDHIKTLTQTLKSHLKHTERSGVLPTSRVQEDDSRRKCKKCESRTSRLHNVLFSAQDRVLPFSATMFCCTTCSVIDYRQDYTLYFGDIEEVVYEDD